MNSYNVQVVRASVREKHILKNLYPLYLHDLSAFTGGDVDANGLFDISFLDSFWQNEGLMPFLIRANHSLAGFILMETGKFAPKTGEDYYISEFFILRKYRRIGVGKQAVQQLWQRYPGKYLLGQLHQNETAIKFWTHLYEAFNFKYRNFRDEKLFYQSFEVQLGQR